MILLFYAAVILCATIVTIWAASLIGLTIAFYRDGWRERRNT